MRKLGGRRGLQIWRLTEAGDGLGQYSSPALIELKPTATPTAIASRAAPKYWLFMARILRDRADWRVGKWTAPRFPLALAVAASAGFPPLLSPAKVRPPKGSIVPWQ